MRTRRNIEEICINRLTFIETLLNEFLPDTVMITARSFDTPLYEDISFEFEFLSPNNKDEDLNILIDVAGYLGGTVIVNDSYIALGYFTKGG